MKFYVLLAAALVFGGCAFNKPRQVVKKPTPVQVAKSPKSSIKGFIKEVNYKDDKYCYVIVGSDTANDKLKSANFCAARYYYDRGDLVYATFSGERLESMLLIREGSSRGGVSGIAKPRNDVVRSNRNIKTKIALPKEESIRF